MIHVSFDRELTNAMVGVVAAHGLAIAPASADLRSACAASVQRVQAGGSEGGDSRREAVRKMLRSSGFKPAGRNKPAQEYLLRTAIESGELPAILNAVDWLNAVSLESGLPISVLSAARLGIQALVRYGRPGETFVFNRSGQELDLEGLICVCSAESGESVPLGTPIKDSMAGKITDSDTDVVAIVYAPPLAVSRETLTKWCDRLGQGYQHYCAARAYDLLIVAAT